MERIRSKLFAENTAALLEKHPFLAEELEILLPDVGKRLAQKSDDILDSFDSFEALLKLVEYINPDEANALKSDMRTMVDQHAALFSSSDTYSNQVMSMLPESPLWNSITWRAVNSVVGKSMSDLIEMLADPCSLRLRCNSRTAQGLPMTVSAFLEIPNTDGVVSRSLLEKLRFYSGRSLTDISTSVWSGIILSKQAVQGSITCKDVSGENIHIDIHDAEELLGILMALSYITCNDDVSQSGTLQRLFNISPPRMWVPADGRIQWSYDDTAGIYQLKSTSMNEYVYSIDRATVCGILECLDALALIDAQYSLPMPRLVIHGS